MKGAQLIAISLQNDLQATHDYTFEIVFKNLTYLFSEVQSNTIYLFLTEEHRKSEIFLSQNQEIYGISLEFKKTFKKYSLIILLLLQASCELCV